MEVKIVKAGCCAACKGPLAGFGARNGYSYYRCTTCGSIQLDPMPTRDQLAEAYRNQYAAAGHCRTREQDESGEAQPYYTALAATLTAHNVAGPVLEIGAGWGGLAVTLIKAGFDYEGIDVSEEMVAACKARNLPVEFADVGELKPKPHAALVLSAVFEHLIDHDAWLVQARDLLAPDGLIITMQPTAHFAALASIPFRAVSAELPALQQIFCPPWHTVLFTIDGMKTLMQRNGFDLVEVRRGPHARGTGITGTIQRGMEILNRAGWLAAGPRWPLVISHIFIFRKR